MNKCLICDNTTFLQPEITKVFEVDGNNNVITEYPGSLGDYTCSKCGTEILHDEFQENIG